MQAADRNQCFSRTGNIQYKQAALNDRTEQQIGGRAPRLIVASGTRSQSPGFALTMLYRWKYYLRRRQLVYNRCNCIVRTQNDTRTPMRRTFNYCS